MPARRRKLRGRGEPDNLISRPFEKAVDNVHGDNSAVSQTMDAAKASGSTGVKGALNNPYTSQAVMLCAMVTLIPLTAYSFLGKSDTTLVQEIVMSCMAMSLAASGITFFVLRDIKDKMFIYALQAIMAVSGAAWLYFAYKIAKKSSDDEDKKDDD